MKYIKLMTLCLALIGSASTVKAMEPDDIVSTFFTLHGPLMESGIYRTTEEGVIPPFLYVTINNGYAIIWARDATSPAYVRNNCGTSNPVLVDKLRQARLGDTIYATMAAYGNCDTVEVSRN